MRWLGLCETESDVHVPRPRARRHQRVGVTMKKSIVTPLLFALLAAPVMAQEPTDTEKRIRDLEKQVQQLQKKDAAKAEAKAEDKDAAKSKKKGIELRAVTDKGQLAWETADGAYKFRLVGRVQFDGLFNSDSDNRLSNGF